MTVEHLSSILHVEDQRSKAPNPGENREIVLPPFPHMIPTEQCSPRTKQSTRFALFRSKLWGHFRGITLLFAVSAERQCALCLGLHSVSDSGKHIFVTSFLPAGNTDCHMYGCRERY